MYLKKSFTLIEILVVIVVIGILSAFILVGMSSISSSANIAKGQAFSNSLRNSLLINLISEWKLDEGAGTSANDSWGTNNGTLTCYGTGCTNPVWRTGNQCVKGSCVYFDGTQDYISVPDSNTLDISREITIEVWIFPEIVSGYLVTKGSHNTSNGNYCIGKDPAYFTYWDGTGSNNYYNTSTWITNNKWSHVVLTYNFSTYNINFYVNGVSVSGSWSVAPDSANPVLTAFELIIGARKHFLGGTVGTVDNFYRGTMDEIRIYGAALSAFRINQNYYIGLNNLIKNNGITLNEFNQRIVELKSNLSNNE